MTLYRNNGTSQEKISDCLKIDKTTTAKAIRKLEDYGFVIRNTDLLLFFAVLNKAVEWEVIKENKARLIKPSKIEKKDVVFLEENDLEVLIRELKSVPVQKAMMVKLFLLTGMRRGELCGLEWKDIDFDKKILSIHRASPALSLPLLENPYCSGLQAILKHVSNSDIFTAFANPPLISVKI